MRSTSGRSKPKCSVSSPRRAARFVSSVELDSSAPRRAAVLEISQNPTKQDHRSVKRVAVMLGFKQFRNAAITIAGIELMHRIRKGQFGLRRLGVQGGAAPGIWNAILGV